MGKLGGALVGAVFFMWITDVRVLDPREINWLMRWDWSMNFFGWHLFRSDAWQFPPGVISTYNEPIGSSIGFTDSVPLVAFLLKPLSPWLPATFQYIGAWVFLCFVLQGYFAAVLTSTWSRHVTVQWAAAALFVVTPTLLSRVGHPALCAHWLLLWAFCIAARHGRERAQVAEWALLGLLAGLIHPYLAAMMLAILAATAMTPCEVPVSVRLQAFTLALTMTAVGWYTSGLFELSTVSALQAGGLGEFSMNLLAPLTSTGWSTILPDLPRANPAQDFEGFQYLGLGMWLLVLFSAAAPWIAGRDSVPPVHRHVFGPAVALAAIAMAMFALSPRITVGAYTVADFGGSWSQPLAAFRSTGRFFWPAGYLLTAWAIANVCARFSAPVTQAVLIGAVIVQAVDLNGAHLERRRASRDPQFHVWDSPMSSNTWKEILPRYRRLIMYPPPLCGRPPVSEEAPAYWAGLYGLSLNAGRAARVDVPAVHRYCQGLVQEVTRGRVDSDALYLVSEPDVSTFRAVEGVVCGQVDRVWLCTTDVSYGAWKDKVTLR